MVKKVIVKSAVLACFALAPLAAADTLEQAIEKAVHTSPALQQSWSRVQSFQENTNVARADYFPTVLLTGGIGEEQTDYTAGINTDTRLDRTELGLIVRQSLFSGLRTVNDVARLTAEEKSERYRLYAQAEQTGMEATEIYLELLLARQVLEVAEQNEAEHQAIRDTVANKVSNQLAPTSDLAQVEGRLASARSSTAAAQIRLYEIRSRYFATIGEIPDELSDPSVSRVMMPSSLAETIARARENHPEILSAQEAIEAARREYRAATGQHAPEVYVEFGATRNENTDGSEGLDENYHVMLRAEWELFSGGSHSAQIRSSSHRIAEAMNARLDVEQQVRQAVEASWYSAQFTEQQVVYLEENVRKSEEAEQGYQSQYDVGRRDLLSLLIVKSETFAARRSYLEAFYQNLIAKYRVQYSMGKLLDSVTVAMPEDWTESED
ncbi:MAG: TolC family outer membrane protein [Gammaproteobacteria bacterium]|nr:TolC family outer membrane protein [Gammaproteobacteria bacterium]